MPTKLERMNNIYYNEPYNSDNFFEIHYCQQFSNIPWEFPEGRYMEFYFAKKEKIDYAVVAPDDPLVLGCVDALNQIGVPCFRS